MIISRQRRPVTSSQSSKASAHISTLKHTQQHTWQIGKINYTYLHVAIMSVLLTALKKKNDKAKQAARFAFVFHSYIDLSRFQYR